MKKLFKWPGSKAAELKNIIPRLPTQFSRVIEPFAGSAALSFHLEMPSVLNDLDKQVINFYRILSSQEAELRSLVQTVVERPFMLNGQEHRETTVTLEDEYYAARTRLRTCSIGVQAAADFYVTRSLAFSGMIRNSPRCGGSNVPYGWYSSMKNIREGVSHHISNWEFVEGSYETLVTQVDDLVFLDPPYRNRAGYQTPDWSDEDHSRLLNWIKGLNCKWFLIHTADEQYMNELRDFNVEVFSHTYCQSFKGRKSADKNVQHLYIRNYG